MELSHAIFAAGCFWGVQATFDAVDGVVSTLAGYTGGTLENPSYERICRGDTNHAEAVLVNFDETIVSYDKLLDIYFASHNPTTLNRQGPDIGTQYRSAIFTANEEQEAAALAKIRQINESGIYKSPVVTQVLSEQTFYPAEEYHQKYLAKRGKSKCSAFGYKETNKNEKDKTDHEWRKLLTPEQYRILREKGTEKPFSGSLLHIDEDGIFVCGACGNPIFISDSKFDSGSGWPSFDEAIPGSVSLVPDFSHGMSRTEVICAECNSHLGHLFTDGPTPTGQRFCINSTAMHFKPQ